MISNQDVIFYVCAMKYVTFFIMTFSNTVNEIRTPFARNGQFIKNGNSVYAPLK
jgi:hypothetical protein